MTKPLCSPPLRLSLRPLVFFLFMCFVFVGLVSVFLFLMFVLCNLSLQSFPPLCFFLFGAADARALAGSATLCFFFYSPCSPCVFFSFFFLPSSPSVFLLFSVILFLLSRSPHCLVLFFFAVFLPYSFSFPLYVVFFSLLQCSPLSALASWWCCCSRWFIVAASPLQTKMTAWKGCSANTASSPPVVSSILFFVVPFLLLLFFLLTASSPLVVSTVFFFVVPFLLLLFFLLTVTSPISFFPLPVSFFFYAFIAKTACIFSFILKTFGNGPITEVIKQSAAFSSCGSCLLKRLLWRWWWIVSKETAPFHNSNEYFRFSPWLFWQFCNQAPRMNCNWIP